MHNLLWLIDQLQNPFFWGFVIFPPLVLLAIWPVIINNLEEKSFRINRKGGM